MKINDFKENKETNKLEQCVNVLFCRSSQPAGASEVRQGCLRSDSVSLRAWLWENSPRGVCLDHAS